MAMVESSVGTCQKDLDKSMADQIKEAMGEVNVWYFNEKYPFIPFPTADQLMEYYIKNGGAKGHRQREEEFRRLEQTLCQQNDVVSSLAQG